MLKPGMLPRCSQGNLHRDRVGIRMRKVMRAWVA